MFSGSMVALVTPMDAGGAIAWDALDALVDWHVDSGTDAIVAVGTTGESATLDFDEHKQVIDRVVKRAAGRVPVIAGTGANCTAEAIELTESAHASGVDACLLVAPYYNKPPQEGLYRHYRAVAEKVPVPQLLYNVPGRTACDISADTVARLAQVDNIIGIKEACGDVSRVAQIRQRTAPSFVILSGEDSQTLIMMQLGAVGTISVTANVAPALMSRFCRAYLQGDFDQALALDRLLQPLHAAMFVQSNPIPAKWALSDTGRIPAGIRLPLVPLADEYHERVRNTLASVEAAA